MPNQDNHTPRWYSDTLSGTINVTSDYYSSSPSVWNNGLSSGYLGYIGAQSGSNWSVHQNTWTDPISGYYVAETTIFFANLPTGETNADLYTGAPSNGGPTVGPDLYIGVVLHSIGSGNSNSFYIGQHGPAGNVLGHVYIACPYVSGSSNLTNNEKYRLVLTSARTTASGGCQRVSDGKWLNSSGQWQTAISYPVTLTLNPSYQNYGGNFYFNVFPYSNSPDIRYYGVSFYPLSGFPPTVSGSINSFLMVSVPVTGRLQSFLYVDICDYDGWSEWSTYLYRVRSGNIKPAHRYRGSRDSSKFVEMSKANTLDNQGTEIQYKYLSHLLTEAATNSMNDNKSSIKTIQSTRFQIDWRVKWNK